MGIEERINVEGAEESKRKLDEVAGAQTRVGQTAEDAGGGAENAAGKFGGFQQVLDRGVGSLRSFIGGLVGAAGLRAALQASAEEAEKAKQSLNDFVDAMASTIALSQDPAFLKIATEAAIAAGRPVGEIGESLFSIVSGTSGSGRDVQRSLLQESIEISKTEPNVPLSTITELMVRLYNVSGGKLSAQQLQNTAIKAEDLGQVTIGQLSRFFPRTLGPGATAGLDIGGTGGIFALLSQVLNPELAATATENILTSLAAPNGEAEKIFASLGVGKDSAFSDRLAALAERQRRQPLSSVEVQQLVGEGPGASGLPVLLNQYDRLLQFQSAIREASAPGAPDLGAAKVQALREILPGYAELEVTRRAEQQTEALRRQDFDERIAQPLLAEMDRAALAAGANAADRALARGIFKGYRYFGGDAISALRIAEQTLQPLSLSGAEAETQRVVNVVVNNVGTQYNDRDPLNDPQPTYDHGD